MLCEVVVSSLPRGLGVTWSASAHPPNPSFTFLHSKEAFLHLYVLQGTVPLPFCISGWHMLWEVAVSSLTRGLGGIWGVSDVMLLVDAIASSLQVVDNPRDRVGKATAGEV